MVQNSAIISLLYFIVGFLELNEDDQIKLIKQGSFEVAVVRYTRLFEEDGMFVPSMMIKVPR